MATNGFPGSEPSSSTWTFVEPDSRRWWAELWAERMTSSSFAEQAVDYRLNSRDELQAIAAAWRRWHEQDDLFHRRTRGADRAALTRASAKACLS